jgi:hypothetical protein
MYICWLNEQLPCRAKVTYCADCEFPDWQRYYGRHFLVKIERIIP